MIDRKTIEELIQLMVEHDLVELDVADGEQSITLRRAGAVSSPPPMLAPAPLQSTMSSAPTGGASPSRGDSGGIATADVAPVGDTDLVIKSPMVGTFYSRANPDAEPFISSGAKVSESTVVCLIEAMKVFNEIKAECRGTVTEILVRDGDAVEYGQPMFRVKPD